MTRGTSRTPLHHLAFEPADGDARPKMADSLGRQRLWQGRCDVGQSSKKYVTDLSIGPYVSCHSFGAC